MNSSTLPSDLYCVMGNPVAHSRSPAIHARFAELTGEHIAYERRLVPMDGFAQGVRAFATEGGRGCNVTVPFKTEAPGLATECSERVRLAGAANTLTFRADGSIYADNTDGLGLQHVGVEIVPLLGRHDEQTAMALRIDEPLGRQHLDDFAHHVARRVEALAQVAFGGQRRSGGELALGNLLAEQACQSIRLGHIPRNPSLDQPCFCFFKFVTTYGTKSTQL